MNAFVTHMSSSEDPFVISPSSHGDPSLPNRKWLFTLLPHTVDPFFGGWGYVCKPWTMATVFQAKGTLEWRFKAYPVGIYGLCRLPFVIKRAWVTAAQHLYGCLAGSLERFHWVRFKGLRQSLTVCELLCTTRGQIQDSKKYTSKFWPNIVFNAEWCPQLF